MAEMTAGKIADAQGDSVANEVRMRGRLSVAPEQRILPSGDSLWSFRVVVPRSGPLRTRITVDAIDCVVWSGRLRRSLARWRVYGQVEVHGSLRRRFYRTGGTSHSRVEVEVQGGRLIRRAGS